MINFAIVIPAKAGIHRKRRLARKELLQLISLLEEVYCGADAPPMDPGLRRDDSNR